MNFRPLRDRVLVSRHEPETITKGGIIIPDTAQEKPVYGTVEAVGPGFRSSEGKVFPLDIQVGDTVVFNKWSGKEIKFDGKDYLILKEDDLEGVVTTTSKKKAA